MVTRRATRCGWLPLLMVGLLVGCAVQDRPGSIGGTPILVIGASSALSPTPTPPIATPTPSASVSTAPIRIQPTPESGYYPAPTWDWVAYGDTIIERAFRNGPTWTDTWRSVFGMEPPKAHNLAKAGESSADGLKRLDESLNGLTSVKYVGLAYGTTDCSRKVPVATFKSNMQAMITKVRDKGLIPVMGTIPYSTSKTMIDLPAYNQAVLDLRQEFNVAAGPDLYAVVKADPSMLEPKYKVAMGPEGSRTVTELWARTVGELAGFGLPADLGDLEDPTASP